MKRPEGFPRPAEQPAEARPTVPHSAPHGEETGPVGILSEREEREERPERQERSLRAEVRAAARRRRRYERAEVRRFTVASRRRRRTWFVAAGAFLTMLGLVAVVAFSPITAVRVIQVEGASRVPPASIVQALSDQLGTPLALVDAGAVHKALSRFTLVQSYATEAHPPDTLVVRIVERDPIGARTTAAGFELIDSAGVVISTTPERPAGFPTLDAATPKAIAAAGEVIRALPADIRGQLEAVHAATRDDVTLQLSSGTRVVWGSADDSVLKAAVFARLLAAAPNASSYDVSSPASPVYR